MRGRSGEIRTISEFITGRRVVEVIAPFRTSEGDSRRLRVCLLRNEYLVLCEHLALIVRVGKIGIT